MEEPKADAIGSETEVLCPPSVPEFLWELIPPPRRREFLEAAAMNLRRAVHPETTVLEMLAAIGIVPPAAKAPPPLSIAAQFGRAGHPPRNG